MRVNADAVCQRCCDLFIHRNVIFHKILRDHRCARPDLGADVLKPVLTLIIVRMMVDADDLISRNIDDVGIALLGIHQYHFVLIRQHFGQILHIQQFNVKNLTQTAGTVPVDLALIADARLDTPGCKQPLQTICTCNRIRIREIMGLYIDMLSVDLL